MSTQATTLAKRLARTGEAIRHLADALPPDLHVTSASGTGYTYSDRPDVELHIDGFDEGLRTIRALGGIWRHTLSALTGDGTVHHYWTGEFHGWSIRVAAIWDSSRLVAEDIVPMIAEMPDGADGGRS